MTFARQETHVDRVKRNLPPEGSVRAIFVTRAQWERSFVIHRSPAMETPPEELPEQIQLWQLAPGQRFVVSRVYRPRFSWE